MIKQKVIKISSIISLIFFTIIFLAPIAKASESKKDATSNSKMPLNEAINNSEQKGEVKDTLQETNDTTSSTSPELFLSLNDQLQWFFSVERPDFADDPYENKNYDNYRATFGVQFILSD